MDLAMVGARCCGRAADGRFFLLGRLACVLRKSITLGSIYRLLVFNVLPRFKWSAVRLAVSVAIFRSPVLFWCGCAVGLQAVFLGQLGWRGSVCPSCSVATVCWHSCAN